MSSYNLDDLIAFNKWKDDFHPSLSGKSEVECSDSALKLWREFESYIHGILVSMTYVDSATFEFPNGNRSQIDGWALFEYLRTLKNKELPQPQKPRRA
jgi:hypothetical protein